MTLTKLSGEALFPQFKFLYKMDGNAGEDVLTTVTNSLNSNNPSMFNYPGQPHAKFSEEQMIFNPNDNSNLQGIDLFKPNPMTYKKQSKKARQRKWLKRI